MTDLRYPTLEELIEQNKEYLCRILYENSGTNHLECLLWQKSLSKYYGTINVYGHLMRVHRLSAYIWLGYDLNDKTHQINHYCPYRNCWNPEHIYIGTHKENMEDARRIDVWRIKQCLTF